MDAQRAIKREKERRRGVPLATAYPEAGVTACLPPAGTVPERQGWGAGGGRRGAHTSNAAQPR